MKIILPWIVAVLALGGVYFLYSSNQSKSGELTKLQQDLEELQSLREENVQLKKSQVPEHELTRLRQNTEDLLRLRNEVRQLRDDKKELTQQAQSAQTAAERAKTQIQAAQAQIQAAAAETARAQQAAALAQSQIPGTNASQTLTPEQQAYAARYGLNQPANAQNLANSCINNLRQIDGAKQQWALENRKTAQDVPTAQEVAAYLKGNTMPKCPAGGQYNLNAAGFLPTCSVSGHALAQ